MLSVNALQFAVYLGWKEAVDYLVGDVGCSPKSKASWDINGTTLSVPCIFAAITSYLASRDDATRHNLATIRSAW